MFSDANLPEPLLISEIEDSQQLTNIRAEDGILFNPRYSQVRLIRAYIYKLLLTAKAYLPAGIKFMVYEAYRPMAEQIRLWEKVVAQKQTEYPLLSPLSEEFIAICNVYAANPYRQGSGHQSGAAVDISLATATGEELDMGGEVRGFDQTAEFASPLISKTAAGNRLILKSALEKVGLVNYPSEWWHYSFGDRLWAKLTGSKLAIFAKIEDEHGN